MNIGVAYDNGQIARNLGECRRFLIVSTDGMMPTGKRIAEVNGTAVTDMVKAMSMEQIDVLICGHMHRYDVIMPGDGEDIYGQKFPVVVGSSRTKENGLTGAAIDMDKNGLRVRMTGPDGAVQMEKRI